MEKGMIGFIGTGNMGKAIIGRALEKGALERGKVLALERLPERREEVRSLLKIEMAEGIDELIGRSQVIFLCVKPQDSGGLLREMALLLNPSQVLVSIMAGITIDLIKSLTRAYQPVIRAMPNTPALIGQGITAICHRDVSPGGTLEKVIMIFSALGDVVEMAEAHMDVVTALSGSGPGFVFKIMEVLRKAAVDLGLPVDIAERLTIQTFIGAGMLARETGKDLETLRGMVTSKGGTTQAGLDTFGALRLDDGLQEVLRAASRRASELGKELKLKLSG